MSSHVVDLARAVCTGALLALTACTGFGPPKADLPRDFLVLDRHEPSTFEATTADGARFLVRDFVDHDEGTLAFWSAALHNDLVEHRGYEPVGDAASVRDAANREGTVQTYRTRHEGVEHGYLTALWVIGTGDRHWIRVAEFTAPTEEFEAHVETVRAALVTLAP